MTNSNISPNRVWKRRCPSKWLVALAIVHCLNSAKALDPNRAVSQYQRDEWGIEQGFPGGTVYAIQQTSDGYLWIGGENGLFRFDGLAFVPFRPPNVAAGGFGPVLGLLVDGEGNLWVRSEPWGVVRFRSGKFQDAFGGVGQSDGGGIAMCLGKDGEPLFSGHIANALKYSQGRLVPLASVASAPKALVLSMAETAAGEVWMGTRDAGLVSFRNNQFSKIVRGLPERKINCILPVGHGELWIGTDHGIVRWTGKEITHVGVPAGLDNVQALTMIKDQDSSIWIGATGGLYRVDSTGILSMKKRARAANSINALFEDREGNLWLGSTDGIERLRDNAFLTYTPSSGLPSDSNGPLYVDAQERTWFAPSEGGLYWLKGLQVEPVASAALDADVVYSIAGGPGELWLGRQRRGLTHLRYTQGRLAADTYRKSDGLAQDSVFAVYRTRDGTVWAGTLGGGVSRFKQGRFTTFTTAHGLAANTVSAIEESADGIMYFATPNGLSAMLDEHWRSYTATDGLPPGSVNCLLEDSDAVLWIGTANGLAFLRSGRIHVPLNMPQVMYESIFGVAQDSRGYLWVATSNHLVRVRKETLMRGVATGELREFGVSDGLLGAEVVKRYRSLISDPFGRIWLSTNHGISVVDPARLARKAAPALVHIQAISADGRPMYIDGVAVRVPATRQRVTFSYAGVSLSNPASVRFRFKLDPFDHAWSEPASTNEAVYTNLSPGSYLFHVTASDANGVWSSERTIALEMEAAYWQTWWFRIACITALLLTALALFRYRMHGVKRQLSLRFEERLAERTRIAQDLHDTLLQGVLSASMQLHLAVERVPPESSAKPSLDRVLEIMAQVIDEGRNAVRGLRSNNPGALNLEDALSRVCQELGVDKAVEFRVIVEGRRRPLHPVLRDEVYRIGREALVNAFRHSRAKSVEVELEYAPNHLRVLVRDTGCGIDHVVLRTGRDGHWGLSGMRERAENIGARLDLWSSAGAGTEVQLSVPGHVAFLSDSSRSRWKAWTRLISKGTLRG